MQVTRYLCGLAIALTFSFTTVDSHAQPSPSSNSSPSSILLGPLYPGTPAPSISPTQEVGELETGITINVILNMLIPRGQLSCDKLAEMPGALSMATTVLDVAKSIHKSICESYSTETFISALFEPNLHCTFAYYRDCRPNKGFEFPSLPQTKQELADSCNELFNWFEVTSPNNNVIASIKTPVRKLCSCEEYSYVKCMLGSEQGPVVFVQGEAFRM